MISEDDKNCIEATETVAIDEKDIINSSIASPPSIVSNKTDKFQVKLKDIPRYVQNKQVKKFLSRFEIMPKKLSVFFEYAYAGFNTEEEQKQAVAKLNGQQWKSKTIKAYCVSAAAGDNKSSDVSVAKRKEVDKDGNEQSTLDAKRVCTKSSDVDVLNEDEQLLSVVTPLYKLSYEDQLNHKMQQISEMLCDISSKIRQSNSNLPPQPRSSYLGALKPIVGSPIQLHYRNKCEFSCGYGSDGRPVVGFRLASCKSGSTVVVAPNKCQHLPFWTVHCVEAFQKFLDYSNHLPFNVQTKEGFWRQITDTIERVKAELKDFFFNNDLPTSMKREEDEAVQISPVLNFRVTSLYYQELRNSSDPPVYELLEGVPYVYENIVSPYRNTLLRFRISPNAFFQTNSRSCSVLYETVASICQLDVNSTVLLDICCGTGTIGIFLAPKVKRVIGIELCSEAVDDANENARGNEVADKCQFMCGKAEDVLVNLLTTGRITGVDENGQNLRVLAVLDPPRAGLPDKIIMAIRRCEYIKDVVYISCDPQSASKNFVDMCRQESRKYVGSNFVLVESIPVDMFPLTSHCELVSLFQR